MNDSLWLVVQNDIELMVLLIIVSWLGVVCKAVPFLGAILVTVISLVIILVIIGLASWIDKHDN